MNPIVFAMRRPVTTTMLVVALISGVVFGLYTMRVDIPALNTPKIYAYLEYIGTTAKQTGGSIVGKLKSYFHKEKEHEEEHRKVVVTSPKEMDVTISNPYVCQIHSQRHIDVCALDSGFLDAITVKEGQAVKKGDVMFEILPALYKAKADAKVAERDLAKLEMNLSQTLANKNGVAQTEVKLFKAKLGRAQAEADQAVAELNFTKVVARFDGIVDRQRQQLGSFIKEGDILTTLSDNSVMWVYFNVPEKAYLEYMAHRKQHEAEDRIELLLANQDRYPHPGKLGNGNGAIEGQFDNTMGNIAFRADFPNPDGLLRHGQTGTILIQRTLKNALVIPQRATFERLDKRYVWVVGEDDVAHQRLITIKHELEDIFVVNAIIRDPAGRIASGRDVRDKIVLEGVREVGEDKEVEHEFRKPEEALKNQKFHAE